MKRPHGFESVIQGGGEGEVQGYDVANVSSSQDVGTFGGSIAEREAVACALPAGTAQELEPDLQDLVVLPLPGTKATRPAMENVGLKGMCADATLHVRAVMAAPTLEQQGDAAMGGKRKSQGAVWRIMEQMHTGGQEPCEENAVLEAASHSISIQTWCLQPRAVSAHALVESLLEGPAHMGEPAVGQEVGSALERVRQTKGQDRVQHGDQVALKEVYHRLIS